MKTKMNTLKAICLTATLAITTVSSTGCSIPHFLDTSKAEVEQSNISVVLGATANEPTPNISLAKDEIYNASYAYGFRNVIVDDGNPFQAVDGDLRHTDHNDKLSDSNKASDASTYTKKFIEEGQTASAETAEKDTATAIRLASNSLSNCAGKKTIVLIDNGISTKGSVAFTTFEGWNVEASLEAIDENLLPDLTGIDVVWYVASTVQPQESLSTTDMIALQDFWNSYLQKCGAESVTITNAINTNSEVSSEGLPEVTTVGVTKDASIIHVTNIETINETLEEASGDEKENVADDAFNDGIKISETILKFKPNSTEIEDKESATELLQPIADALINSTHKVIILGTTATVPSEDKCVPFSLKRAETVKKLLVEMGVPENKLQTKGLGYENEFHVNDIDANGSLNDKATENRAIYIFDITSETGSKYAK